MALCKWTPHKDTLKCSKCGFVYRWKLTTGQNPRRLCRRIRVRPKGPGDYLHDGIKKWVGEGPTRKCGCEDRIRQMNAWGPEQCREHIEEITDWLMEEAGKRGWWKVTTIIPCRRFAVRQLLILPAIQQAENEITKET